MNIQVALKPAYVKKDSVDCAVVISNRNQSAFLAPQR